ncbi:uncharacterized protein LOC116416078 [Nasonia vitripennis]|uniref:Uncharacterized protein n=1 Tax=Nasonia vitripennis TaxID=7425 RepID=A0A7M7PY41_NASVI|nr:uncharacterized protein LOC116416078 [Nasonia vitripennis]
MSPIGLLALEKRTYLKAGDDRMTKARKRSGMLQERRRWVNGKQDGTLGKGRCTHRLIPKIEDWIGRRNGEVNYYPTQFLTGHECFRAYLHRFKLDDRPNCPMFGCNRGCRARLLQVLTISAGVRRT